MIIPKYPALNIYSHIASKTTALGPLSVATVVHKMKEWDVEVIDENNLCRYVLKDRNAGADHEILQSQRPADVVGFYGGLTSTIPRLYELARFYKEKGVVTIAGGQHFVADNIAEALNSGIDYVVLGEGEETIEELLNALLGKGRLEDVKGIAYRNYDKIIHNHAREPINDLDKLPLPDFSLIRYARIKIYPVERIRGCGMNCEFCTVKGKPRYASPERLLEAIKLLVETRSARHFFIVDDLFGQQKDETIRFCQMLRDYQLRIGKRLDITVQIRLDKAKEIKLLYAMREAGINIVAIGFESPIREELMVMNKHIVPEDMISFARIFHKFGFLVHGMFIFGYPLQEGMEFKMSLNERIEHFKKFIKKAKIDTIQVLLPVPLPGTELRQRLEKQNRIYPRENIGWEYYDGNFPLFEPDEPLTAKDMQYAVRKIMGKFYQFKYMFAFILNVFLFASFLFFFNYMDMGWRRWYRSWRNALLRFIGWIIMKKWMFAFKKDKFLQNLERAKEKLLTQQKTHILS